MDYEDDAQRQSNILPQMLCRLRELLALQRKYQPHLALPLKNDDSEVCFGFRDGSAHILRYLKVWYDLPTDVLCISINIVDRFLTKMKVLPKHLACVCVASFHIACKLVCVPELVPEPPHIIRISQCQCTLSDIMRMESIIMDKLDINENERDDLPVTALTFLRLFNDIVIATEYGDYYKQLIDQFQIFRRLEIILCCGSCVNYEASMIALVLLCSMVDVAVSRLEPTPRTLNCALSLTAFLAEIQEHAKISDDNFYECLENVLSITNRYDSQSGLPNRQKLLWRVSHRTLKHLRPTKKLMSLLPTIEEQGHCRTDA